MKIEAGCQVLREFWFTEVPVLRGSTVHTIQWKQETISDK